MYRMMNVACLCKRAMIVTKFFFSLFHSIHSFIFFPLLLFMSSRLKTEKKNFTKENQIQKTKL